MKTFIDEHRDVYGVEPICKALPIAPSTYYDHAARKADPGRRSQRAKTDEALAPEIERVWSDNFQVYGVRKVWRQMRRERFDVARCTVQRLMKRLGLEGVVRGKPVRTTVSAEGSVPARSRESAVHRRSAECAVGERLHLRLDVARVRLRGLRD